MVFPWQARGQHEVWRIVLPRPRPQASLATGDSRRQAGVSQTPNEKQSAWQRNPSLGLLLTLEKNKSECGCKPGELTLLCRASTLGVWPSLRHRTQDGHPPSALWPPLLSHKQCQADSRKL